MCNYIRSYVNVVIILLTRFIACVAISHFPPSIYDTLSEKNLRDHYEFPDRKDGMHIRCYIYIFTLDKLHTYLLLYNNRNLHSMYFIIHIFYFFIRKWNDRITYAIKVNTIKIIIV